MYGARAREARARASFFQTRALRREARVSNSGDGILKGLERHLNFNSCQPFLKVLKDDLIRQLNCLRFIFSLVSRA